MGKENDTSFKKGWKGGPGRPPDPPEVKLIRQLSREQVAEIGSLIISGDVDTLDALAKDKKTTILKAMFASCAVKIIRSGNSDALNKLLDRVIGKVPQPLTIARPEEGPDRAFHEAKMVVVEIADGTNPV